MRAGLIVGLVVLMTLMIVTLAFALENQWTCQLRLDTGSIGGKPSDSLLAFGVRPGATDGWDSAMEGAKLPLPPPPYVSLFWYRTTWGESFRYAYDWRSPISATTPKTWEDLRTVCDPGQQLVLSWTFGGPIPESMPPGYYTFKLFDEGISPNPTGGTPYGMKELSSLAFEQSREATHYFHIVVNAKTNQLPRCEITTTTTAFKVGETINFDSHATDPDGTIAKVEWTFGDGATASGITSSHIYSQAGSYEVRCKAFDNSGATKACEKVILVENTAFQIVCPHDPITISTCPMPDLRDRVEAQNECTPIILGVGGLVTIEQNPKPGDPIPPELRVVVFTATDGCGNIATCETPVKVVIPPFTCTINHSEPVTLGQEIQFSVEAQNPCGEIVSYSWNFGDGGVATGKTVTHTFTSNGSFRVTCTVTDNNGLSITCSTEINLPAIVIECPKDPITISSCLMPDLRDRVLIWEACVPPLMGTSIPGVVIEQGPKPGSPVPLELQRVVFEVSDACGNSARCESPVIVTIPPPTCNFTFAPDPPQLGQEIQFTAVAQNPCSEIASITWKFGDETTATGNPVTHTYYHGGVYRVTCTVTFNNGQVISKVKELAFNFLKIACPTEPIIITTCPMPDLRYLVQVLNACSVLMGTGDIVELEQSPKPGGPIPPELRFVIFTATDGCGNVATCQTPVRIDLPNHDPICDLKIIAPLLQCYPPPRWVILDASGSSDPDQNCGDRIVKFEWDLDNDGIFDDATGPEIKKTFEQPGPHLVCVKVTDSRGASSKCCQEVVVPPNLPPICRLTVGPEKPIEGQKVTAEVDCQDPEGDLVKSKISWGDGSESVAGPRATHIYKAGEYTICATCTDVFGNTSKCCQKIFVQRFACSIDVRMQPIVTKSIINLKNPEERKQRVKIMVKNESLTDEALVNVLLYRWRFGTNQAMNPIKIWERVSIAPKEMVTLTPEFYYQYSKEDWPVVTWKAVVKLLNCIDPNPENNIQYKEVHVFGGWVFPWFPIIH